MSQCVVDGCSKEVTKPGLQLCYDHWKADKEGRLSKCEKCGAPKESEKSLCYKCFKSSENGLPDKVLKATEIGKHFDLTANKLNAIFVELGWITKGPGEHGWITTPQGRKDDGIDREFGADRTPFVTWGNAVLSNRALVNSIREFKGEPPLTSNDDANLGAKGSSFREKYPPTHRATDGHMVRSRGEMLIDNWLYAEQIIHAYERRVPIEEELYCDFYLPTGKVYIEFWGMESDPAYVDRKKKKISLYEKNGFQLIEIHDKDISNLDDVLAAKLRQFNIKIS